MGYYGGLAVAKFTTLTGGTSIPISFSSGNVSFGTTSWLYVTPATSSANGNGTVNLGTALYSGTCTSNTARTGGALNYVPTNIGLTNMELFAQAAYINSCYIQNPAAQFFGRAGNGVSSVLTYQAAGGAGVIIQY